MMSNQKGKTQGTTQGKTVTQTEVKPSTTTLTPLEDKVVRMRHGLKAPLDLELEMLGSDNPELAAQLAEIEKRALAQVGPRSNSAKRKIVGALRRK